MPGVPCTCTQKTFKFIAVADTKNNCASGSSSVPFTYFFSFFSQSLPFPTPTPSATAPSNVGAIVGGVLGGLAALLLLYYLIRLKKGLQENSNVPSSTGVPEVVVKAPAIPSPSQTLSTSRNQIFAVNAPAPNLLEVRDPRPTFYPAIYQHQPFS